MSILFLHFSEELSIFATRKKFKLNLNRMNTAHRRTNEKRHSIGDELEINLGSQEVGVYLIRIETSTGVATKRVVLTK